MDDEKEKSEETKD